jgi:hypothetical protein
MSSLNHYADCVVRAMHSQGITAQKAIREVLKVGFTRKQLKNLHQIIRDKIKPSPTPLGAAANELRHKKSLREDF